MIKMLEKAKTLYFQTIISVTHYFIYHVNIILNKNSYLEIHKNSEYLLESEFFPRLYEGRK